jgi:Ca2+/Na+ antiporter
VHTASLRFDLPVMALFTMSLVPIMLRGLKITRAEGISLLVGYAGFLGWQIIAAAG